MLILRPTLPGDLDELIGGTGYRAYVPLPDNKDIEALVLATSVGPSTVTSRRTEPPPRTTRGSPGAAGSPVMVTAVARGKPSTLTSSGTVMFSA